ncbi:acyl carrier protein [Massilia sp. LXY-6]|uniref:acyl carrier protein n=1 Tax=Massilia sp. LXY-6 TaxID=3379823 RepID=UPI003EE0F636
MYLNDVKQMLADVLSLDPARAAALEPDTALLGNLPELDSMAVVSLVAALEDRFGIMIDDDEISASTFASVGSLTAFVAQKLEG